MERRACVLGRLEGVAGQEGDVEPCLGLQKFVIGIPETLGYLLDVALPSVAFIECREVVAEICRTRSGVGMLRTEADPFLQSFEPVGAVAFSAVQNIVGDNLYSRSIPRGNAAFGGQRHSDVVSVTSYVRQCVYYVAKYCNQSKKIESHSCTPQILNF